MDGQELLRLSVECYKSIRRKYPARVRWTPEFEAWRRYLLEQVGAEALDVRVLVFDPSDWTSEAQEKKYDPRGEP